MGILSTIKSALGWNQPKARTLVARYDIADSADEGSRNHWAHATGASATAILTPETRAVIRNRARYESVNNSYLVGMLRQKANDVVGTGPRLRVGITDEISESDASRLDEAWLSWSTEVNLGGLLRTMVMTRVRDGEAFALSVTDYTLTSPSKLNIVLIDCDRVASPLTAVLSANDGARIVDGIELDANGKPVRYYVLKEHPGGDRPSLETITYPADLVVHWFIPERPEQFRGVSELAAALPIFADTRRLWAATLRAAELAATISGVLSTDQPTDSGVHPEPMDVLAIPRGSVLVAPDGYRFSQVDAKHPNSEITESNEVLIAQAGRPLLMPANIATGNSSKYNYSSGRLDNQSYDFANAIERENLRVVALDSKWFPAWFRETWATLFPGRPTPSRVPHQWFWDTRGHVDPLKETKAMVEQVEAGLSSYPSLLASMGKDWRVEFAQQAAALGVSVEEYQRLLRMRMVGAKPVVDGEQGSETE